MFFFCFTTKTSNHITGNATIWNDFFDIFGEDRKRVASFEQPLSVANEGKKTTKFIDLFWKGLLLIEQKSYGQSLDKAYEQGQGYLKNLNANENDRNCWDKKNKLKLLFSAPLSDSLKETSGLVFFDGFFWTHNDDHDSTLYGLDNSGKIKRKIKLIF